MVIIFRRKRQFGTAGSAMPALPRSVGVTPVEELAEIIRELHGVPATHRTSVPVNEVFRGRTVCDGIVEVFDPHGHPKANTAYAWSHVTDDPANPKRHVTVLHIPPAVSPQTAVRAAIAQEFRSLDPT